VNSDQRQAVERIKLYRNDPEIFCKDVLGVDLDPWQRYAFKKLLEHRFIAVRSGSGVGKTFWESAATLWFLFTHPHSKVPTTAPSQHQLQDLLWGEHFRHISESDILKNMMTWTSTRIGVKGYEPRWHAVARTGQVKPGSETVEGLQGFHDESHLLFVIDEASGVHDAVFPAVEGALTHEGAYCIMCGNPTRSEGYFYDTFTNPTISKMYFNIHVSCYDSPRVSERYIKMMEERYGKDHPVFKIKVLGEFPDAMDDWIFPPDYIEKMQNTSRPDTRAMPVEFGVDVGRTGASSILCIRRGFEILKWDEKHKPGLITDTKANVDWVVEHIYEYDPQYVKVDAIGVGAGVYDGLKDLFGDRIVPVVGNASPNEDFKDRYVNLRAQGYWELRNLLPFLYCSKWPERLITELSDIRTKPANKLKVESKDDMRRRAMKSPDYADALYMAFLNAEDCWHVRPEIHIFPSALAETAESLKKDVSKTKIGKLIQFPMKPRNSRFRRDLYGTIR
jgi:phage terminase large subunit